jgi:glycosyltransferase involved in cell wall biosynthesis
MKISIVTPSFNQGHLLERTMRSVLDQEGDGFELEYIVVDGGSTDGSREIIEQFADRLAWWCSEPDAGQYAAINKGFAHATGDVMAWINSSDIYLPWTLKSVSDVFRQFEDFEWITSLYKCCNDDSGGFRSIQRVYGYSARAFAEGLHGGKTNTNFIQQEACFWRRSLWEKIGGEIKDTYKLAADFHLWSEFFEHAQLVGLHAPLAAFRYHGEQRSRISNYEKEVHAELDRLSSRPTREAMPVINLYPPASDGGRWRPECIPGDAGLEALNELAAPWREERIADDGVLFHMAAMEQEIQRKEAMINDLAAVAQERLDLINRMQIALSRMHEKANLPYQLKSTLQSRVSSIFPKK